MHFLYLDHQGSATKGVFTYFFWVLLQPFRGNPDYEDVAELPYNSTCLAGIKSGSADIATLGKNKSLILKLKGKKYI